MANSYDTPAENACESLSASLVYEVPAAPADSGESAKSVRVRRMSQAEPFIAMSILTEEDSRRLRAQAWRAVRKLNPKAHVIWAKRRRAE